MNAKNVLLFVLFQGVLNVIVYAAEEDSKFSRSVFITTPQDKQLKGHVVKRFECPSHNSTCTQYFATTVSEEEKITCYP